DRVPRQARHQRSAGGRHAAAPALVLDDPGVVRAEHLPSAAHPGLGVGVLRHGRRAAHLTSAGRTRTRQRKMTGYCCRGATLCRSRNEGGCRPPSSLIPYFTANSAPISVWPLSSIRLGSL